MPSGITNILTNDNYSTINSSSYSTIDGINIKSITSLRENFGPKISAFSEIILTLSGNDINSSFYNEVYTPINLFSGSKNSRVIFSAQKEQPGQRISHNHNNSVYGQNDFYVFDKKFSENQELLNPLNYFESNKNFLKQTTEYDHLNTYNLNGIIDIFNERNKLSKRLITSFSNGFYGFIGNNEDSTNRSNQFSDGYFLNNNSNGFFIDNTDYFGNINKINTNYNYKNITPFVEYNNDNHKILSYLSSSDLKSVVLVSGNFEIPYYDKYPNNGFLYENSIYGLDSIAFGGLLNS